MKCKRFIFSVLTAFSLFFVEPSLAVMTGNINTPLNALLINSPEDVQFSYAVENNEFTNIRLADVELIDPPLDLKTYTDGRFSFGKAGLRRLRVRHLNNEVDLEVRVGIDYKNLFTPSKSSYNDLVWGAFKQNGVLKVRNGAFADWVIPKDIRWNEDPFNNLSWQFIYQSMSWWRAFVYGFDKYADKSGIDFAEAQIFNWWQENGSLEKLSERSWHDHATANRAAEWLYLYHRFFIHSFNDEQITVFKDAMQFHAKVLSDFISSGRWKGHNHSFYHALSLFLISMSFSEYEESDRWRAQALDELSDLFDELVFDEGVSTEQSIAYHFNALYIFSEARRILSSFVPDSPMIEPQTLLQMAEFGAFIKHPNEIVPAIGNTSASYKAGNWIIDKVRDLGITSPELEYIMTKGDQGRRPPVAINYPESGYHILRRNFTKDSWEQDAHLVIDGAKKQSVHGHNDALNVMYYKNGNLVLVDAGGPYSYSQINKEFRFNYFNHAKSHNTVLFDGEDYASDDRFIYYGEPRGTSSNLSFERLAGEGKRHQRQIFLSEKEDLVIVDYVSPMKSTYVNHYWHFDRSLSVAQMKIANDAERLTLSNSNFESNFYVYTIGTNNRECEVIKGREYDDPRGPMGWSSPKLETRVESPTFVCTVENNGSDYFFVSVLPDGLNQEVEVAALENDILQILIAGEEYEFKLQEQSAQ